MKVVVGFPSEDRDSLILDTATCLLVVLPSNSHGKRRAFSMKCVVRSGWLY